MCATEESLLLKGFQLSIIDWASFRPGAGVSTEGWPHSIGLTYELSISLLGSLALRVGNCETGLSSLQRQTNDCLCSRGLAYSLISVRRPFD